MRTSSGVERCAGFSLVEVMVALIVIAIGLLGIAKMQALALSSTGTSRMRALASLEAASLASTMRADRTYWASIPASLTVNVSSTGAVTGSPDSSLNSPPASNCSSTTTPCTSAEVAAQDLYDWTNSLTTAVPGGQAVVQCNVDASGLNPVSCSIQLTWTESLVALNTATNTAATAAQTAAALQAAGPSTYTLYVEP